MTVPEEHTEVDDGYWDMHKYEKLVELAPQYWQGVHAQDQQGHQGRHTGAVDVSLTVEVALEDCQASLIPYWCNIERNRMDKAEKKANVGGPPMQYVQPLVAYPGQEGNEIGLHTQRNNPRHHSDGEHSRPDCQRRRAKSDAGIV